MRFEVKIDVWLRMILWICILAIVPFAFYVPDDEIFIIFISVVVMALIILPLMYYSYYELKEDHLLIRMSVFKMKVKYKDITNIRPGKFSKMNNMAFSFDAVIIERKNMKFGEIAISPQDKEIFISELRRRCPLLNDSRVFD